MNLIFFMNYFFARSKRWAVQIIFMTQVSKLDDWRIGDWARTATNWRRILIVSQNYVYQPNAGLYCPKKPLCLNPDTISVTQLCLKIYNCRIFTKLCIQYIDKGSWDFQVCTWSCLFCHMKIKLVQTIHFIWFIARIANERLNLIMHS